MQGISSEITQTYSRAFSKNHRLDKDSAVQARLDESIPDYYERFEKTFKRNSGLTPESFSNHQNDPLLNSAFLEGLDGDLPTLVKRHNPGCSPFHTNALLHWLTNFSKPLKRKKREYLQKLLTFNCSN